MQQARKNSMGFWDRKGFWEVSADDDSHIFSNPNKVTEDYFRTGRPLLGPQ
jgi:hypothetical protein